MKSLIILFIFLHVNNKNKIIIKVYVAQSFTVFKCLIVSDNCENYSISPLKLLEYTVYEDTKTSSVENDKRYYCLIP